MAVAATRKIRPAGKDADAQPMDQDSPETVIYNKIHRAIAERRLLPGSRLIEDQLA